ncbi:MAG: YihY/virulence factor BrkB family protein [Oscillospiraceae bacterium]|nr:YihY/virulence factor BrkB family protein [Oscillospiraceae bacterium]
MKLPKTKPGPALRILEEAFRVYNKNEMSVYAGYTTLYILMAMVPLLSLLIGVVNLLPDVSLQHVEEGLQELLPSIPQVQAMVHSIITNVNRKAGSLAISVSLVASLWSASNGVNALQKGLHKLSGKVGSFVRDRAAAMLYTVIFIALIPALLIFRVLRGSIEELIAAVNNWLNIPDIAGRLIALMEYSGLITAVVMALVILLTYTFLQGERRKLRYQLPGALFTTVLWLVFSRFFELFIQRFWQASSLYGSLAAIFLAAMWLKSIMMILFYGAALNETLNRRRSPDGKVLF